MNELVERKVCVWTYDCNVRRNVMVLRDVGN